jgi:cytoskeletal protein CcmA (bactofilin family)
MLFIRPRKDKRENDYNIISAETNIEGKIYSPRPIKIEGTVTGEIISSREVVIGREGKVRANVKTRNIIIEGNFKGNIILSGEVKITSTGVLFGNIIQMDTSLNIENGGLFKGKNIITDNREIFNINSNSAISNIKIKPKKIMEY